MLSKAFSVFLIYSIIFSKYIWSLPITTDESSLLIDGFLRYYIKRVEKIQENIEPQFEDEMNYLLREFSAVLKSNDLSEKDEFLEHYGDLLSEEFHSNLQNKLELQFMDEEIAIEKWYLEKLLPQVSEDLKVEIQKILEKLDRCFEITTFDEKYDQFLEVIDDYSDELKDLMESDTEEMLDIHLEFFENVMEFLIMEDAVPGYKDVIEDLITKVKDALASNDISQKKKAIEIFDSMDTSVARFVNSQTNEFLFHKFLKCRN